MGHLDDMNVDLPSYGDLRAENKRLRAALLAQEQADQANVTRVDYERWQQLEDKAKELRRNALGLDRRAHEQAVDK